MDDMTELLAEVAVEDRPRLFAIYGTSKRDPEEPLIGWGMELAEGAAPCSAGRALARSTQRTPPQASWPDNPG